MTCELPCEAELRFILWWAQVRWGHKPDGVCMVVGSCCRGFDDNTTGLCLLLQ